MTKLIHIYRADPEDREILAVVYPPGRITRTDDPNLIRRIRAAIADKRGAGYDPRSGHGHPGPAGAYPQDSLDWLVAFLAGLNNWGLRGAGRGYRWPAPAPDIPERTY